MRSAVTTRNALQSNLARSFCSSQHRHMRKAILIGLGLLLICFGLMVPPTVTVTTYLLKPSYASTAIVSISPSNQTTVAAEMVRVQSPPMLDHVITNLNLMAQWGRKFGRPDDLSIALCRAVLQGSIRVTEQGNAQFVITGFSDDREEAAVMANSLAQAYQASTPGASVAQTATASSAPFRPNKRRNILVGCVVGLCLVGVGAYLIRLGIKTRSKVT